MAKTVRQLTPQELRQFDPTRNLASTLDSERWATAQAQLPELLAVLREHFAATRVVLFGSLTAQNRFTRWSDIDLAVWGIPPEKFYDAIATLNELSPDIKVDLVDPERCQSATLKDIIQAEGVTLWPTDSQN
jgi:predicted nucleotidyltransferase